MTAAGGAAPVTSETAPARSRIRRRTVLIALSALLALVVLIAAGLAVAAMTLTTADVIIELKREPVAAETTFRIVADGGADPGGEIVIPGRYVTLEVTVEASVPATGTASVGVTPATGVVQLANPGNAPVDIQSGTTAVGDAGLEFRLTSDATVPAATADAPGLAEASVEAVTLGTAGNVGPGELSGVLDSGVFFSNRLAELAGGTDESGTVVADEDLSAVRAAVAAAATDAATGRFAETLQSDVTAIPSTFEMGEPRETFDHVAGDPAETVSLRAVYTVTALTYAGADVDAVVRSRLIRDLAAAVPAGYTLDESTIRPSTPSVVEGATSDATGVLVSMPVSARAVAAYSGDDADALAERLSGQDDAAARETLEAETAIEAYSVRHAPGWLARGMPDDAGRIEIRIDD